MIWLIARREIETRIQQRSYRISLAVILLIVAIVCVLPTFLSSSNTTSYDIGVAGRNASDLQTALYQSAREQGIRLSVEVVGADEARNRVRRGSLDAAILDDTSLITTASDSDAVRLAQSVHRSLATTRQLSAIGLSPGEIQAAIDPPTLPVTALRSNADGQRQAVATVAVVILFSQLITYITWVANGVVEEKSSRVVELLLAAVRPVQLLAGKLIGIGGLAIAQVALIGADVLIATRVAGTLNIGAAAFVSVLVAFLGFILGFAFFSAVAAALASTVSRQEELSGVMAPATVSLTVCYLCSVVVANSPNSTFSRVVSILPPVSALTMPARIARGGVAVIDLVLAVGLILLATLGVLTVAARIYRAAVLHTGSRVSLRRAWRGEAIAELS